MCVITPDYYPNFKCIADSCKHSCCIGWEIDIDNSSLERYNNLNCDFAHTLKSNIEFSDTPHFKLDKDERCPFLNQQGLCDIITNLGEDMLCQICSDHPRFRNFYNEYEEIGLGLCCEAAANLILSKKDKTNLNLPIEALQIPIINYRQNLFIVLQDDTFSIEERVDNILYMINAQLPDCTDWYNVFNKLEKLDSVWDDYLLRIQNGIAPSVSDTSLDYAYEQLLVYLIFRHFLDGQYDGKFKERVLFAVLIYKIIRAMNTSNTLQELLEIARLYSSEIEYSDENTNQILSTLS